MNGLLHYPGGVTDEQYVRLVTYNEMCKSLFYDFWRTEEITLKAFFEAKDRETYYRRARLHIQQEQDVELTNDPEYSAFLERADMDYDEEEVAMIYKPVGLQQSLEAMLELRFAIRAMKGSKRYWLWINKLEQEWRTAAARLPR